MTPARMINQPAQARINSVSTQPQVKRVNMVAARILFRILTNCSLRDPSAHGPHRLQPHQRPGLSKPLKVIRAIARPLKVSRVFL